MNGINQIFILIAEKKFDFFSIFRVYLNLNSFFYSTLDDLLKAFVVLNRSNTVKAIR